MTDLPEQLDVLAGIEWDLLLVLDALRWDYWRAFVDDKAGTGMAFNRPVWSPGNCTGEWIRAAHRVLDFSETICITANPEVTRHTADYLYAERDDLWERKWEYFNGIGTVPPEAVTEAVEAKLTVGIDRRIYAHFAQPHGPYPMHDPPIPVMRNNPEAGDVKTDHDEHPDEIIMDPTELLDDPESWLTAEMLQDAYRSNLEWVWTAVEPLLDRGRTVVVTSDHGELLGDAVEVMTPEGKQVARYGHPTGDPHDVLRTVPLAVYDD